MEGELMWHKRARFAWTGFQSLPIDIVPGLLRNKKFPCISGIDYADSAKGNIPTSFPKRRKYTNGDINFR